MDRLEKLRGWLQVQPQDSFLKHALALEYIKIGQDGQARALFEEILQRQPDYIGSYYHLAKLLERLGEKAKARACYEKGMEMAQASNDTHSYLELQRAYEELAP
jgi:Tfp pilus assembly protein PilF